MTRVLKYEIEERKNGIAPSTRLIKIDGTYLLDACPHCGRGGLLEFPSKEIAEKYIKDLIEIAEKNMPSFIDQLSKGATQLQISHEQ